MTQVKTDYGDTKESARRERVEQTTSIGGHITATNVQTALQALDTGKQGNVGTIRLPVAAASIAITATDTEVGIDTTATAVTANLPSASAWATQNPNGLELTLVDINGHAAAHNITPALNGADVFYYGGVTPKIQVNFGLLKLRPGGSPVNGWYVRGIN
jgi:hypothetical protein